MAAPRVFLRSSCFLSSPRPLKQISRNLNKTECMISCTVKMRTLHTSEKTYKNDKFNLSNQTRRRRKFNRNIEKQKDSMSGKVQPFQLDSLPGDVSTSTTSSIRQDALASTLQQAMTSLLEGNEVDSRLLDCNIEITKVKIAKDYGHATFYWRSMDESDSNDNIEELLQSNQNAIRLLLPSYHNLYISPRVIFMWDKQLQYLADVNTLLMKTRQQHSED